ncbi:MAG TPA: GGDEF domain-containing response regulator [Mizugakiibacter sp.]|nr:GGDEF domain-containing response regulator [Mizugakiibacter sp.]
MPILIDPAGSAATPKTADTSIGPSPANKNVAGLSSLLLVGEDGLLQELEILYTQDGVSCCHVDQAATALAMLQGTHPPELILLGTSTRPQLTDLSEKLRAMRIDTHHDVSLLVILDQEGLSARLDALQAGADHAISRTLGAQVIATQTKAMLEARKEKAFRVLVIDDDAPQAAFAEAILRRAGMQIRVVTDALNSLDELDQFRPDLILMDVHMPGADGLELTRLIREREDYMTTPIVFLSGDQDNDHRFAALAVGGDDFITKPVRPQHLISAISRCIRRTRLSTRQHSQKPFAGTGGLCDRNTLLDRLHQRLAAPSGAVPLGSLGLFEFDHLSALRQELGLSGLDRLVQEASHWLAERLDSGDYIAPFGQSAMLLLAEDRHVTQLTEWACELIQAFTLHRFGATGKRALYLSVGICSLDTGNPDPAKLFERCKQALELAHQQGSMAIAYSEQLVGKNSADFGDTLRTALDNEAFHLVFQPLVPVGEAPLEIQYQTLLRLRDKQGYIHSAVELIPQAKTAKLLDAVDRWVLKQAISIIAAHQQMGTELRLFVSQSFAVIGKVWSNSTLQAHLLNAHIPESSLVLEYRATEVSSGVSRLAHLAADLRSQGVCLALSQIHDLKLARTLLDACTPKYLYLVPELADSPDTDTLAELAHAHDVKVIGPRVDNAGMAAAFYSAGVDYLQGSYIQEAGNTLNYAFPRQG